HMSWLSSILTRQPPPQNMYCVGREKERKTRRETTSNNVVRMSYALPFPPSLSLSLLSIYMYISLSRPPYLPIHHPYAVPFRRPVSVPSCRPLVVRHLRLSFVRSCAILTSPD